MRKKIDNSIRKINSKPSLMCNGNDNMLGVEHGCNNFMASCSLCMLTLMCLKAVGYNKLVWQQLP